MYMHKQSNTHTHTRANCGDGDICWAQAGFVISFWGDTRRKIIENYRLYCARFCCHYSVLFLIISSFLLCGFSFIFSCVPFLVISVNQWYLWTGFAVFFLTVLYVPIVLKEANVHCAKIEFPGLCCSCSSIHSLPLEVNATCGCAAQVLYLARLVAKEQRLTLWFTEESLGAPVATVTMNQSTITWAGLFPYRDL